MKKTITISILLLVIGVLIGVQPCFAETQKLTIVFSGDMRGELENCHCPKDDFGGLPRRAKYIDEVRKEIPEVLLLDVGDVLPLPTPELDNKKILSRALVSFKAMDMMGYDVMNVGESDLILGEEFLEQKEQGLSFSLISANIVDKHTGDIFFRPYVIKTMKNDLRVGILGIVNERYVINSEKLEIVSNKEIVSSFLPDLKSKVDLIVVLGHLGLPYSLELAKSIEGIDVILSGHWDVESQEPMRRGNTLIMPTVYHSRKIGRLDLEIQEGDIYSYTWESTPLGEEYDGHEVIENLVSEISALEEKKVVISPQAERIAQERPLKVFVFYSPGCRACMEIDRDLLPEIEEEYGDQISIEHLDTSISRNYEQMIRLERLYGAEEKGGYVPEVIVSRYVLIGKEEISTHMEKVIEKALAEPVDLKKNEDLASQVAEYHPPAGHLIISRFESFSVFAVLAAGLLDGINPCAFTTIVFFISFLAFVGYRKREMFFAGTSFTAAVFITYLLIGLGIFRFLRVLKGFSCVIDSVDILIILLAFLLGVLSLVDYFRFKKTKDVKDIILKLPQSIKNRIHSVIGSDFRTSQHDQKKTFVRIIWIAFTAGFMVSMLESFCTGQVYLPTIAFVFRIPDKRISALSYLILYNLAFIMPLVAVFLLGLFGIASKTFSNFMERRLAAVKLSTALLFFTLGTLLVIFR